MLHQAIDYRPGVRAGYRWATSEALGIVQSAMLRLAIAHANARDVDLPEVADKAKTRLLALAAVRAEMRRDMRAPKPPADCDCDACCNARWWRDESAVMAAMIEAGRRREAA